MTAPRAGSLCIPVFGDDDIGKLSWVTALTKPRHFVDGYDPTLEVPTYILWHTLEGHTNRIQIEPSDKRAYAAMRGVYISHGDAHVIMYDVTSTQSFEYAWEVYENIGRVEEQQGKDPRSPICLVGNKSDLGRERAVSTEQGSALATKMGCPLFEMSAHDRTGIKEPIDYLVLERRKRQDEKVKCIESERAAVSESAFEVEDKKPGLRGVVGRVFGRLKNRSG